VSLLPGLTMTPPCPSAACGEIALIAITRGVGACVGDCVGVADGNPEGVAVGPRLGDTVGRADGSLDGATVGKRVGTLQEGTKFLRSSKEAGLRKQKHWCFT
jgi:hypothetical protein